MFQIVRTFIDPAFEKQFLSFGKSAIGFHRWHLRLIRRVDAVNETTALGISRHDRFGLDGGGSHVQSQVGFAFVPS